MALIHSSSNRNSPGPWTAPSGPPSALNDRPIPVTRAAFRSSLESMILPRHVGRYFLNGTLTTLHSPAGANTNACHVLDVDAPSPPIQFSVRMFDTYTLPSPFTRNATVSKGSRSRVSPSCDVRMPVNPLRFIRMLASSWMSTDSEPENTPLWFFHSSDALDKPPCSWSEYTSHGRRSDADANLQEKDVEKDSAP